MNIKTLNNGIKPSRFYLENRAKLIVWAVANLILGQIFPLQGCDIVTRGMIQWSGTNL